MRLTTALQVFLFLMLMLLVAGCGIRNSNLAEEYNEFGVKCAKMGLWNEAIMRWQRVVQMDPNNAKAHNNLGVAYESKGKFEAAMAEYSAAIELDPENKIYTSNYSRFKQNYEHVTEKKNSKLETKDPGIEIPESP